MDANCKKPPSRRRALLGTAALALLLALTACGTEGEGQDTSGTSTPTDTVTTAADTSTAVTTPMVDMDVLPLTKNGESDYVVISARAASAEMTAITRTFISDVEKKTGIKLKLYPESYAETDCEIIVGMVHDRDAAALQLNEVPYTSWRVTQDKSKIIVTAYTEEGLQMALDTLFKQINKMGDEWVVLGDIDYEGSTVEASRAIPACMSKTATVAGIYECGEESLEVCLRRVAADDLASYRNKLAYEGWQQHTENELGVNRFATYTHADKGMTIHLGYYPTLQGGTLRIVSEPTGYLPATSAPAYTRVTDTTFTQIGRKAVDINSAPGMSYIMQLADGSFILVDGGPANTDDENALFEYLKSLTPAGQKPVIAAWFITHAHSDHMALANNFLTKFHTQVDIRMAAYNFPNYEAIIDAKDVAGNASKYTPMIEQFIGSINQYWPEAEHFVIHAGQKLYLADAEIEILFTHEDLFPGAFTWINHTSTAFRIRAGGKSVMILGDCEKTLCQQMSDTFGDYLKSDMLQLSHHGFNGACLDLYKDIDPEICFWACSQTKFETDERTLGTKSGYDFNAYLRDTTIRAREHYHSGVTTVIPMS